MGGLVWWVCVWWVAKDSCRFVDADVDVCADWHLGVVIVGWCCVAV